MSIAYRPIAFAELASLIKLPDNLFSDSEALVEIVATYGSFLAILRRDIFGLKFLGFPIKKVILPSPNLLVAVKYVCVYWVNYLHYSGCPKKNGFSVDKRGYIDDFL
ncbi:hypothetical protein N7536_009074 [Penicillium majusculum]|nr:hypothetical protein N7536_009074 [Penicillium majusculum]